MLLIVCLATIQVDWDFWRDIGQLLLNVSSKTWQKFCFPSRILKWESGVVKILHIEIVSYSVISGVDWFVMSCSLDTPPIYFLQYGTKQGCVSVQYCWFNIVRHLLRYDPEQREPFHNTTQHTSRKYVKLSRTNSLSRAVKLLIL